MTPDSPTSRWRAAFLDMLATANRYRLERDTARAAVRRHAGERSVAEAHREALRLRLAYLQSDSGVSALQELLDEGVPLKVALGIVVDTHRRGRN